MKFFSSTQSEILCPSHPLESLKTFELGFFHDLTLNDYKKISHGIWQKRKKTGTKVI